ncbi:MAG: hypothetical protein ABI411_00355 [Tahibacter sp.]
MTSTVSRHFTIGDCTERVAHVLCALISVTGWVAVHAADGAAAGPHLVGLVHDTRLAEISGMTRSMRRDDRYWVHNDSGNRGDMFAIDEQGSVRAKVHIAGVKKLVDPEDIAAFELDGRSYLLLADTGDNGGVRKNAEILILEEPSTDATPAQSVTEVVPAWRVHFHYSDTPHDVEAVAVDVQAAEIVLLTKRTDPPELWTLPLRPGDDREQIAERRASLRLPTSTQSAEGLPKLSPTGLVIAPDGSCAYVLTYREVWRYARLPGQSWPEAFQHVPTVLPFAFVPQAEAIAITRDGQALRITGEHWPAPIVQIDLEPALSSNATTVE